MTSLQHAYIFFFFKKEAEMCQKRQCIHALLFLDEQTKTLVDMLPEEEIKYVY